MPRFLNPEGQAVRAQPVDDAVLIADPGLRPQTVSVARVGRHAAGVQPQPNTSMLNWKP